MTDRHGRRVSVVGTTGSGKTTTAAQILLDKPEYNHLKVVRLRSPQRTDAWLLNLKRSRVGKPSAARSSTYRS